MGVGTKIKSILRDKGMTIKQLSENSGISLNTLYSITKRDSTRVDNIILQRIADTLQVHVFDLTDIGNALDSVQVHWSVEKDGRPLSESEIPDGVKDLLSKDIRTLFDSLSPVEKSEALEIAFSHQLPPTEIVPEEANTLRSTLLRNFDQLNQEGQERLVETSDDMVSSGKYIKSDPNKLGKAKKRIKNKPGKA